MIKEKNSLNLIEILDLYNPNELSLKNLLISNKYKIEIYNYNTDVFTLSNISLANKYLIVKAINYEFLLKDNEVINLENRKNIKKSNKILKEKVYEAIYIYLENNDKKSDFDIITSKYIDKKFDYEFSNFENLLNDLLINKIGDEIFYSIENENELYSLVFSNLNLLKYNYKLKDKEKYTICVLNLMLANKDIIEIENYNRAKEIIKKLEIFRQ